MPADWVRKILPPDTAATWDAIAPLVPSEAYLGGGTAIAVHLAHRVSRDLDFFFHHGSIDLDKLSRRLSAAGPFAVTERSAGTLNGVFSATKVQFLHADEIRPQHLLEPPRAVDGLDIAGLSDLMAMKLKVVGDRGELRDYFDLMTIEQRTGRTADEGLALFVARFQPEYPQQAIDHILLGLGYFDDVDPDDALPVPRDQIVEYWTRRQPEIVAARGRLSLESLHHRSECENLMTLGEETPVRQDPDATTTSERDSLVQYLDYQRETILLKTEGLTKDQLAWQIPTSGLTLAGILYHLALVEEGWFEVDFLGHQPREDFAGIDWQADPDYEFRTALEKEPEWLRRRYRDACDRARQVVAAAGSLDDASAPTRADGKRFTLRWVMLHLIEETARHAGHADLLREAIDGVVGE
jgi:uncharacterized damage-inducible protein DinB